MISAQEARSQTKEVLKQKESEKAKAILTELSNLEELIKHAIDQGLFATEVGSVSFAAEQSLRENGFSLHRKPMASVTINWQDNF